MTNLLIQCPACNKDMGISAEKCMHCGTGNPKILAQKESLKKNIKLIGLGIAALVTIYLLIDYNSTYKKCMREGNSSGLLKESFVESMCKMAASKS